MFEYSRCGLIAGAGMRWQVQNLVFLPGHGLCDDLHRGVFPQTLRCPWQVKKPLYKWWKQCHYKLSSFKGSIAQVQMNWISYHRLRQQLSREIKLTDPEVWNFNDVANPISEKNNPFFLLETFTLYILSGQSIDNVNFSLPIRPIFVATMALAVKQMRS